MNTMFLISENKNFLVRLFCVLFTLCSFATISRAQDYFDDHATPEEIAAFAFFKAAKAVPNYESWIKTSSKYKQDSKQGDYLIKEMLRLERGYNAFSLDKDVIKISRPIVVKYISSKEMDGLPHLTFRFLQSMQGELPAFDYSFGNDIISLSVDQLDFFADLELSPVQDASMQNKIPYKDAAFDAILEMRIRPYKADYDTPEDQIDNIRKWPMKGKIASIKCIPDMVSVREKEALWDYIAPWYEEQHRIETAPKKEKEYPHPYDLLK